MPSKGLCKKLYEPNTNSELGIFVCSKEHYLVPPLTDKFQTETHEYKADIFHISEFNTVDVELLSALVTAGKCYPKL
jgi:hypothetical protein